MFFLYVSNYHHQLNYKKTHRGKETSLCPQNTFFNAYHYSLIALLLFSFFNSFHFHSAVFCIHQMYSINLKSEKCVYVDSIYWFHCYLVFFHKNIPFLQNLFYARSKVEREEKIRKCFKWCISQWMKMHKKLNGS